jgi:hypothetical protein
MSRIEITDSVLSMAQKLSEGNPGAINVIVLLLEKGEAVDPDAALGGLMKVMMLDTYRIYGPRIWMLYKDVCGESIVNTIAVLRAVQLGLMEKSVMNHAIDNYGEGVDCAEVLAKVRKELPRFAPESMYKHVSLGSAKIAMNN